MCIRDRQSIDNDVKDDIFSVFYKIPAELTKDKENITVKLQAKDLLSYAAILELRTTKEKID